MTDASTIVYTAVYGDKQGALADLEALQVLRAEQLLGQYDAAVIDKAADGLPHVVKRLDKPSHRVLRELFGRGALPRQELHQAAAGLSEGEAALIVVAHPTIEKALGEAVAHALQVAERSFDKAAEDPFAS